MTLDVLITVLYSEKDEDNLDDLEKSPLGRLNARDVLRESLG